MIKTVDTGLNQFWAAGKKKMPSQVGHFLPPSLQDSSRRGGGGEFWGYFFASRSFLLPISWTARWGMVAADNFRELFS